MMRKRDHADAAASPLLLRAIRREAVARRPLWLMRQAGRCLPEYRALRERHSFEELSRTPELAAEVTLLPLRRFPFDAAIVFADIVSPLPAMGVRLRFDPGPVFEAPLRTAADIAALPDPDHLAPEEVAPEVTATLSMVRSDMPRDLALLGFGGAPLTLAAYLVEGRGSSAGFPAMRALARSDPRSFHLLLDKLSRLVARYLVAQHRAGADVVQVFDSWAGLFSRRDWQELVRPHLVQMLEEVGRAGVPRILYLHGAPHLVDTFARLPCEALGVDWRTDLELLRVDYPNLPLQGNLDPAILVAGPAATTAAARQLLRHVPRRGHIVNLGHGVLPETPLESIDALVEAVHAEAATARKPVAAKTSS
jgi:uroporphyrinogen decarboxylase